MRTYKVEVSDDRAQPALKYILVDYSGFVCWPSDVELFFPAGTGEYSAEAVNNFLDFIECAYRVAVTELKIGDRVALRENPKFVGRISDIDENGYFTISSDDANLTALVFDKQYLLVLAVPEFFQGAIIPPPSVY
jgi:hypothetical protein